MASGGSDSHADVGPRLGKENTSMEMKEEAFAGNPPGKARCCSLEEVVDDACKVVWCAISCRTYSIRNQGRKIRSSRTL